MVSNCRTQLDLNVGIILYKTGEIQVGIKWDVLGSIPTKGRRVRKSPEWELNLRQKCPSEYAQCATNAAP